MISEENQLVANMQILGSTSTTAVAAGAVSPSNPLAAKRQSTAPVLKSSSRTSLTGAMSSTSAESLAKFQAIHSESISLRPNRRPSGMGVQIPTTPAAPTQSARPSLPLSPRSVLSRTTSMPMRPNGTNLEESLRKTTLIKAKQSTSTSTSTNTTNNNTKAPIGRLSSMPVQGASSTEALTMAPQGRRPSSMVITSDPANIQVLRRSVSIVGALPSTSPPSGRSDSISGSPSILEIRSQIPCRNLKTNGVCHFGSRCHYKHDSVVSSSTPVRSNSVTLAALSNTNSTPALPLDNAEVDKQILGMRSQIPCRNFAQGCCTFGNRCFYKHCDSTGKVVEETGIDSLSAMSLLRFPNPYGDGDICAAGVIPYARAGVSNTNTDSSSDSDSDAFVTVTKKSKGGSKSKKARKARASASSSPSVAADNNDDNEEVWALFQVEDMLNEETGKWSAALAMFGGKVGAKDEDWLHTAAREFAEETGFLVGDLNSGIPSKMAQFTAEDEDTAFSYTKYLEFSKFQCLYYPVTDAADLRLMQELPQRYADEFKGEVSKDWTRAATRLEPVLLLRSKSNPATGWKVCDINTREPHTLPIKVPLAMALRAAEFPWQPEGATTSSSPSVTTQLDDLLGGLDSLLNISIPTTTTVASAPSAASHRRRRSSIVANLGFTLNALDESPHEAAYATSMVRSSNEILCN